MNIIQRAIAKTFSLDIGGEKRVGLLTQLYNATFGRQTSIFTGRTVKQATALQVSAKGLIFTCIDKYEKAELAAPIYVRLRVNQKESQLAPLSHRGVRLFDEPNPVFSNIEIRALIDCWLIINGNVFILTPDFDFPFPLQMWILDPTKVRIVIGKDDDLIQGYEYQGSAGLMFFPEKYVCHIRTLKPSAKAEKLLVGTGLVEAVLDSATIDAEIAEFSKRFFANDARPPQVLRDDANTFADSTQWQLFKSAWNNELKNNQLMAKLGGGMKIESLEGSTVDVDIVAMSKMSKQSITEPFSIPLVMIEGNYGSRATAQVVESFFYKGGVNPFLRIIDSALTKHFRQWDENIIIEHEYYVDNDADEKRLQEMHELSTGQKTINELLKAANLPTIGIAGDTRFVPSNLIPLDKAIAPTPPPSKVGFSIEDGKKKDLTAVKLNLVIKSDEDPKLILWKSFDKLTMTKSEILQGEISRVFGDLEKEVLGNVNKRYKAWAKEERLKLKEDTDPLIVELILEAKPYSEIVKADLEKGVELFNEDEWIEIIEAETNETLTALQKEAILASLGAVDETLETLPSSFSDTMKKELEKSAGKISESIGTIKGELTELIKNNNNVSASELKDLITAKFDTLKVSRAENIAQTTANYTTNAAQSKTWGAYPIECIWLTQRDGKVRDTHSKVDGKARDEKGLFYVGGDKMEHPCGGGLAEENCYCRCMLFPERKGGKMFVVNLSWAVNYLRAA